MIYKRTTDPTDLAVSVANMKIHLGVTSSSHDTLIQSYIEAATGLFENRANVTLGAQVWDLSLEQSEVVEKVELGKYPVNSFSAVTYYDSDNVLQSFTHSQDDYIVFLDGRPSALIFADVPSVYDRYDAMTITFTAGFTTIPEDIQLAIKMLVWRMYYTPSDPVTEKMSFVDKIVRDYRSWQL